MRSRAKKISPPRSLFRSGCSRTQLSGDLPRPTVDGFPIAEIPHRGAHDLADETLAEPQVVPVELAGEGPMPARPGHVHEFSQLAGVARSRRAVGAEWPAAEQPERHVRQSLPVALHELPSAG